MNLLHNWYCGSKRWAKVLQGQLMPWVLYDLDLGGDVLELGPGPGLSTDWLQEKVPRLTAIEVDQRLARSLAARMDSTNVTVVAGDATSMPFADASFSAVVCFTMLHHVPSPQLQDRLLAEAFRVLRPGGVFAGYDSLPSLLWNLVHIFDTKVPVDPERFPERLKAAGFDDIVVRQRENAFRFRAHKPAG